MACTKINHEIMRRGLKTSVFSVTNTIDNLAEDSGAGVHVKLERNGMACTLFRFMFAFIVFMLPLCM